MNDDTDTTVLDAMRGSLGPVAMRTPVEAIVAAGRRRRRGRTAVATAGAVAAAGLAVAVTANGAPDPPAGVHVHTAAYSVDSGADGTVRVSWTKQQYFDDHDGLQAALRRAGIPVLVKVGEFCRGQQDDPAVDASGTGPGVDRLVHGERLDARDGAGEKADPTEPDGSKADKKAAADGAEPDGKAREAAPAPDEGGPDKGGPDQGGAEQVVLVFTPSAMPAGKQLFIGYLNPAQLAVTGGHPGSVERLVPLDEPLTCTTDLPTTAG